jgi:hypothetical protein
MFNNVVDPETIRWSMSSDTYIKRSIADVEQHLLDIGETLIKQRQPILGDYHPELDSSSLLNDKLTNYYQGLIGVLRWVTELGRLIYFVQSVSCPAIWQHHAPVI